MRDDGVDSTRETVIEMVSDMILIIHTRHPTR